LVIYKNVCAIAAPIKVLDAFILDPNLAVSITLEEIAKL